MSARDRQMLAAAYIPVIAFTAVVVAALVSGTRQHELEAACR
jgi:hypothetical protein